jgi:hypothetical protein
MGVLLSRYKKVIIDDIIQGIQSNNSNYYVFASNPIYDPGLTRNVTTDDYTTTHLPIWQMLFGKKLSGYEIIHVIKRNMYTFGAVYDRYDNTVLDLHTKSNFYCISNPTVIGGDYNIYKCIDNNNGGRSTVDPGSLLNPYDPNTFQTSDDYKWRYITSISKENFDLFATRNYFPVYSNNLMNSTAPSRAGVEVVVITTPGSGYDAYTNGVLYSAVNNSVLQLSNTKINYSNFYNNCSIYINTSNNNTSELLNVSKYETNTTGSFVYLTTPANTSNFTFGATTYYISPRLDFDTDGDSDPIAYAVINTFSNSISSINVLDIGSNITRANVTIANTFGSGANLYCIAPPPGGHGFEAASELDTKGFCMWINFANTEANNILASNVVYNKVGIFKDPYSMTNTGVKGVLYTSNTFSQVLSANLYTPVFIPITGDVVVGANSTAKGIVVQANSTTIDLVGDKNFIDGESISVNNVTVSTITINKRGDVYQKIISPMYTQNINDVTRSTIQTESFKFIVQV